VLAETAPAGTSTAARIPVSTAQARAIFTARTVVPPSPRPPARRTSPADTSVILGRIHSPRKDCRPLPNQDAPRDPPVYPPPRDNPGWACAAGWAAATAA